MRLAGCQGGPWDEASHVVGFICEAAHELLSIRVPWDEACWTLWMSTWVAREHGMCLSMVIGICRLTNEHQGAM